MPNPVYQGVIQPKGLEGLKGLRGWGELSQEEQSSWLEAHPHAKNYSPLKQSVAYRNNNYLEALGQPAFDNYDTETLSSMYRAKVVNEAFDNYYKNDSNYDVLSHLTTDSKQELLESGYLNEQENAQVLDTKYENYAASMKEAAKWAQGVPGGFRWDTKDQWVQENAADRQKHIEAVVAKDNKKKVADSQEDIDALYNYYTAEQKAWSDASNMFNATINEGGDLNEVISYMAASRLITPEQGKNLIDRPVEQKANLVGEILTKSEFNPARIDNLFDSIALPKDGKEQTEFGEVSYKMPGSRTYNSLQGSDRFKDFGASDKLREYVTWNVLAQKYGTVDAISNLETSMTDYAHTHEGAKEWVADVGTNIVLGGIANIMNKVNAIGNLVTEAKDGSEALAYKLQGKNPDGSDREQPVDAGVFQWFVNNWDNPYYWSKVDEYNTLDPLEIAEIDAKGGISPYVTVRPPDEVVPFFSTETLKEALKMSKFVWSDYLTGRLLGGITSGASSLATRAGGAGLGKVVSTAGALGTVAASGMGIAESYGVMTYEQAYQEMMQALDEKRDSTAQSYAQELMQTPKAQQQIDAAVNKLMQQQIAANAGKENPLMVSEEDIRRQVENDFISYHTQQYNNSDEAIQSRNADEAIARRAAANAYMVDATIEELRMAASNFVFRKYLFDRGTRAALGDNTKFAAVSEGANRELGVVNKGLNKALATIKPVWGGFESNYFDDVTVGFGKGFGLAQYNSYLQDKYDPEKAGVTSDYALSFLEGLGGGYEGALGALTDRQSFYDGFVGALGAPMSVMPRFTRSERTDALKRMNREDANNLTIGERINKAFMNPLLDAYYEEKGKQERTEEALPTVNRAIADNKEALEDINQLLISLNSVAEANITGDHIQRKDSKENQAFRLLYTMSGLTSSPIISEHPLVQNAADEIDRLAAGKVTEEEIKTFLSLPENASYTAYADAEERATQRITDNAKSLQKMSQRIASARDMLENSVLGQDMSPALQEQLIYQLAMNDSWQERLSDIETTLTGRSKVSEGHNAVAAYGSKEEYERQVAAQISTRNSLIQKQQDNIKAFKDSKETYEALKANKKATADEIENAKNEMLMNQLLVQTTGEAVREARVKLKEMKRDASVFEGDEVPVLSATQILALNPTERNTILDKRNRSNYSEAQQVAIDEAIAELRTKSPDAARLVLDASKLDTRIKDNKKALSRIQGNPDAAAAYVSTINTSRASQLMRVYAQRRVDETYRLFDSAQNNEELLAVAKKALNSKEFGMNSAHLDYYIKKNPEKGEILNGLLEVSKVREDASGAINSIIETNEARKAIVEQIVNATNDANNGEEAMSALEGVLDIQTDATAKLQFDRVLERLKSLGHQRDATKVRNREAERQQKQEAEERRLAEEAKREEEIRLAEQQAQQAAQQAAKAFEEPTPIVETKNLDENSAIEQIGVEDVELDIDGDGKTTSPTVEKEAKVEGTPVIEVPTADITDQGNIIVDSSPGVISGNRLVEYSIDSLKEGKIEREAPKNEDSAFGKLRKYLDNTKTKLQEIVDEEFGRIITDNPNQEVRFMVMRKNDPNNPFVKSKMLFNVIELTPQLRQKYHNEDRGGVIQANGKTWLIVGTTGFESNASTEQMKAYDTMRVPITKRGDTYFSNNSGETYYVDDVAHTTVQNTTSGRIVNQRGDATAPRLKKVSELLASAGMTLRNAVFGIQTKQTGAKSFATTKNAKQGIKIFPPRNVEDNRGRVFIMVETANGNMIPGMIEPTMFNNLQEGTPLKEMINETLGKLFSTNYETRREGISQLRGFLVLNDEKNILIGTKDANVITIKRQGMPDITQQLGENFDGVKFAKDLENANFQINITLKSLNDPVMLKMYDDSGALMTTVDSMRTAGMSYSLYMTDSSGEPIVLTPVGNATPGTGKTEFKRYRSARVGNTTYELKNGQFVNRTNGNVVNPGTKLETSCIYNLAIQEGNWIPFVTKDGKEYYNVAGKDGNIFVITRDGLGNVDILSQQASDDVNIEIQRKIENKARLENLEEVNLDEAPTPQVVKKNELTPEQVQQQAIGNFTAPAEEVSPMPTSEVVKEAKESQPTKAKEVITDVGTKSLAELQNTEKISTFVEVAASEEYSDLLYDVLEAKGWNVTGDFAKDEDILRAHKVSTTGITNVQDWINQIRDCK